MGNSHEIELLMIWMNSFAINTKMIHSHIALCIPSDPLTITRHEIVVSKMVTTKIRVHNSAHEPRKKNFFKTQKGENLFFHLDAVFRHPCCDQLSDCDVQWRMQTSYLPPNTYSLRTALTAFTSIPVEGKNLQERYWDMYWKYNDFFC